MATLSRRITLQGICPGSRTGFGPVLTPISGVMRAGTRNGVFLAPRLCWRSGIGLRTQRSGQSSDTLRFSNSCRSRPIAPASLFMIIGSPCPMDASCSVGVPSPTSSRLDPWDRPSRKSAHTYWKRPFTCPHVEGSRISGSFTTPLVVVSGQGASPAAPSIPAQDIQATTSLSSEQSRNWM
jgi:hypothetical protein